MDFNSNGFRHGEQSASKGEQRQIRSLQYRIEVSSILIPELLLFSILSSCLEHFIVCADHGGFDDAG